MRGNDEQRKVEQRARLAALEGPRRADARRTAVATARVGRSPPREIGLGLALGIAALPVIFSWFTLRRGFSTLARVIAFLWLAAFLGIGAWSG